MKAEALARGVRLRSIRAQLIVSYTLLIVIPLSLLGWVLLGVLDRFYVARLQDYMSAEAGLLAEEVANTLHRGASVDMLFLHNSPPLPIRTQPRVLVFDREGRLLIASDPALDSQIGRVVQEAGVGTALAGQAAQGVQPSNSSDNVIAYVALPAKAGGQVLGAVHLDYALTDIERAQRQLRVAIIAAGLLGAVVASLVSIMLTNGITQPLAGLSAAAAEIASGGLRQRVAEERMPTELVGLAHHFNQMAEALQRAEYARRATFANVAHDVRTPLGSIRAAAEALTAGAVERPELRTRLLSGIVEQSQYLGRLTDDLLRLAAYESGGLVLRLGCVDLRNLLAQVVESVSVKAEARSVHLTRDWPAAVPPVQADADRILEVLFNLTDNALTYTPPGGQIHVWAEVDAAGRQVWVNVRDSGPGIPPDALPHLFERLWRGDYRGTSGGLHMGLGLNIAREIVVAHGGRLIAANRPQGGADFRFSLPFAAPATPNKPTLSLA